MLVISAALIFFTGLLPSFLCGDWQWFSRSGAILIVYGIYIVWLDYQTSIDTSLSVLDAAITKKIDRSDSVFSELIHEVKRENRKLYQTIEFLIFGKGTLIWGYGDLIGKFYII